MDLPPVPVVRWQLIDPDDEEEDKTPAFLRKQEPYRVTLSAHI